MCGGTAAKRMLERMKKTRETKYNVFLQPKSANDAQTSGHSAKTNIKTETVPLMVAVEQLKICSNLGSSGM